jgi:rhodanese-related sulfurtransferase
MRRAGARARVDAPRIPKEGFSAMHPRIWRVLPVACAALLVTNVPLAAAQSTVTIMQSTLMEPNQKTAEVSTEELLRLLDDGNAVVIDARPPMEFATSHIPGARNVGQKPGTPTSLYISDTAEIERQLPDRSTPLVLYCNGPYCSKSKRLSEELLAAGYTSVGRYQLGAPTWRALVGTMQIELDGLRYVFGSDHTAVFFDAREPDQFGAGSLPGARNLLVDDVEKAKDDGRLPMDDHNTRIVVFGADADQARAVADRIAHNAFHNVTYYGGALSSLEAAIEFTSPL